MHIPFSFLFPLTFIIPEGVKYDIYYTECILTGSMTQEFTLQLKEIHAPLMHPTGHANGKNY